MALRSEKDRVEAELKRFFLLNTRIIIVMCVSVCLL